MRAEDGAGPGPGLDPVPGTQPHLSHVGVRVGVGAGGAAGRGVQEWVPLSEQPLGLGGMAEGTRGEAVCRVLLSRAPSQADGRKPDLGVRRWGRDREGSGRGLGAVVKGTGLLGQQATP